MRFQTLFRYRQNMMAAAIVMILLYHSKGAMPEIALKRIAAYFYGGVDIFFFASGIGCFFSLQRDRDPAAFLRRRAARVLPAYLPFITVWLCLAARSGAPGIAAVLANLFGVQSFAAVEPAFNWYVSGMWLSYLLSPFLSALAERARTRPRALLCVLGLLLLSAAFWGNTELIILMARLPVFFTGMLFAAESRRRERLTRAELLLLAGLVPLGALLLWEGLKYFPDQGWSMGLAWYPMLLIVPGLCVLLAAVSEGLSRFAAGRALNRAAAFLGGVTFEIYLVHFWTLELPLPLFLPATAALAAALWGAAWLLRRALRHVPSA